MAFTFLKQFEKTAGSTLVVDALNLAFRWKHQGKTDFAADYIATVQSLAQSYNCEKIIITADQGSSSYRRNLDPGYKQNRKDKYAEQTEGVCRSGSSSSSSESRAKRTRFALYCWPVTNF